MSTRLALLELLADGAFHSGTALGDALGISRAAVHKAVESLADQGLELHRVTGRGYRLVTPATPLRRSVIEAALAVHLPGLPIEVLETVDSTNQFLLREAGPQAGPAVCLAEVQTAGRGRRGRSWAASPYRNLTFSLRWRFEAGPAALAGLSLVAGLAVHEALQVLGVRSAGLKWPNDLLWQGRKLAGLLAEVRGELGGPSLAVLGVGINVHVAAAAAAEIDQPWVDLATVLGAPCDRNTLAVQVILALARAFERFGRDGFAPFQTLWERAHLFQGQDVLLSEGERRHEGRVLGVEATGALRLRLRDGGERSFHAGEVSLRPLPQPLASA